MASSKRVRSRLGRLAGVALEDFGLRRSAGRAVPVEESPPAPVEESPAPTAPVEESPVQAAPLEPSDPAAPVEESDPAAPVEESPAPAAPVATEAPLVAAPMPAPPITEVNPSGTRAGLPPGVVWHGAARRSPELQRFVEHLEALRGVS